jgi:GAF domain-containing protein
MLSEKTQLDREVMLDPPASKSETYRQLLAELTGLFSGERDGIANLSNMSALIYSSLPMLNWAGFYLLREGGLVLGPFQGRVACVRIALGQGVCGTAAQRRETTIVPDVHAFPGHIACDSASRSEIVIPMIRKDRVLGVLDLDSPQLARFDQEDASHLNEAVALLLSSSDLALITG